MTLREMWILGGIVTIAMPDALVILAANVLPTRQRRGDLGTRRRSIARC